MDFVVQPPVEHVVVHALIPQRNSHPPPLHELLHDEPVTHSVMHPPPEQEKSHVAPPSQRNVQPPLLHVLSHDVPPSHTVVHEALALGQVKSHFDCTAVHRCVAAVPAEPPSVGVVGLAGAPTSQS